MSSVLRRTSNFIFSTAKVIPRGFYAPTFVSASDRLVYASDLIPGRFWVHLPISMGYDRYPELLIDEKNALLTSLAKENAWLFYVHDPDFAVSKVQVRR